MKIEDSKKGSCQEDQWRWSWNVVIYNLNFRNVLCGCLIVIKPEEKKKEDTAKNPEEPFKITGKFSVIE